ncbi:MAG: PHP domain-containing protein [Mycoplasma sp.]
MKHNYHSHTAYCRHSENELDVLVKKAIEEGFTKFGISEHMPIPTNPKRIFTDEEFNSFLEEFKQAKEKYKGQIELSLGLECEYHKELNNLVAKYFKMPEIQYLIFGNHFYGSCAEKFVLLDEASKMDMLIDQLINLRDALETRMFSCINHPDWFLRSYKGWDNATINLTKEMIKLSVAFDVPLEFNMNGHFEKAYNANKWMYPYENFWREVAKSEAKVIIGVDAHNYFLLNTELWDTTIQLTKDWGIYKNLTKEIKFQK